MIEISGAKTKTFILNEEERVSLDISYTSEKSCSATRMHCLPVQIILAPSHVCLVLTPAVRTFSGP